MSFLSKFCEGHLDAFSPTVYWISAESFGKNLFLLIGCIHYRDQTRVLVNGKICCFIFSFVISAKKHATEKMK